MLVLFRRWRERVAVNSNRAVNRCWASEAIVRFDYREIGKGASRADAAVSVDDAWSDSQQFVAGLLFGR